MRKQVLAFGLLLLIGCGGDHGHHHGEWNRSTEDMVREFNDPERDKTQKPEEVIQLFGETEGQVIADIGAGAGYFTFKLAEEGAWVIATEIHQGYLDFIQEQAAGMGMSEQINTILVGENDPGLTESSVDGVLVVDVYHHINDRTNYFGKVFNAMRVGGKLVILEYKKDSCLDDGPPESMRLDEDQIVTELMMAGFDNVVSNEKMLDCQIAYIAKKEASPN